MKSIVSEVRLLAQTQWECGFCQTAERLYAIGSQIEVESDKDSQYKSLQYYKSIVYDVCTLLDCGDLKTVCGSVETPSRGVQEALRNLIVSSSSRYVGAKDDLSIEIERNDLLATENVKLAAHLHLVRNALRGIAVALKDGEPLNGKPFRMTPQEAVVSRDILIEHARTILSEADSEP